MGGILMKRAIIIIIAFIFVSALFACDGSDTTATHANTNETTTTDSFITYPPDLIKPLPDD